METRLNVEQLICRNLTRNINIYMIYCGLFVAQILDECGVVTFIPVFRIELECETKRLSWLQYLRYGRRYGSEYQGQICVFNPNFRLYFYCWNLDPPYAKRLNVKIAFQVTKSSGDILQLLQIVHIGEQQTWR